MGTNESTHAYTTSRIDADWTMYASVLRNTDWYLDTWQGRILYGGETRPSRTDIELAVAPVLTYTGGVSVSTSEQTSVRVSTIADFAGMVETGELVPLPAGATAVSADGLLTVTEDAVSYSPTETPTGAASISERQATASRLPASERQTVTLQETLGADATTFIRPGDRPTSVGSPPALAGDGGIADPANPRSGIAPESFTPINDPIQPNSLRTGDAQTLLRQVQSESVQLACFSPPYNIGKEYDGYTDNAPIEEWYGLMRAVFRELFRAVKPDGKVVVNIGKSFGDSDADGRFFFYPLAAYIKDLAIEAGFDFWDEAIWHKRGFNGRGGGALMGSYPDPTNLMITQTHEHVLVFRKWVNDQYHASRELPPTDSDRRQESKLTKERWRETTQSIWDIDPVRQSSLDTDHSAVFPEELPKSAIQLYSFKGDTVLDPFAGLGTTCVAAKRAGRDYIGFDLSTEYVEYARERVAEATADEDGYVTPRDSS